MEEGERGRHEGGIEGARGRGEERIPGESREGILEGAAKEGRASGFKSGKKAMDGGRRNSNGL